MESRPAVCEGQLGLANLWKMRNTIQPYWLITSWSSVLDKLIMLWLVKKFSMLYGIRRFITASSCPFPEPNQSTVSILPFEDPLYSHLTLGLRSGLFPSGFFTKTLYAPLLSPCHSGSHFLTLWIEEIALCYGV